MPSLSRAPNKKELEKLISIYLKAETAIINEIGRLRSQEVYKRQRLAWNCTANTGRPGMGRRKGEKIMKIPAEFEDILRGVESVSYTHLCSGGQGGGHACNYYL